MTSSDRPQGRSVASSGARRGPDVAVENAWPEGAGGSREPLAVIGMSALYPGSESATALWLDVVLGRDRITDVPASRWRTEDYWAADPSAPDRTYSRRGGFIPDVTFDPLEWGIPPATLAGTDPVQLLALGAARHALRDALGAGPDGIDRDRVSVFVGASGATQLATTMAARLQRPVWRRELVAAGLSERDAELLCDRIAAQYPAWSEAVFPGYLNNVIAGRIANRLDLRGTNCTLDAACASSLAALKMGAQELWLGEADLVVAGGADALCDPLGYMSFAKCSALSKTDDCRPFSSGADGTIISEGIGLVVLERLADAERNGRQIYAVVRGIGSSSDGRGTAIYAPSADGQALAMRRAYRSAGVLPDTVELLEAHGTGTPAGELAEVRAAREVFEDSGRRDRGWCAIGSIKSQIGHTKAAAGVAGLVKAVLALQHKVLPPTIKVDRPNPGLDLGSSPFYINTQRRPWVRGPEHPRRAAVSSFGFGGTNFHVVLEEYVGSAAAPRLRRRTSEAELVLVMGSDAAATASECLRLADELGRDPGRLAALARASRKEYSHAAPSRVAVVGGGAEEVSARLRAAARRLSEGPRDAGAQQDAGAHDGRVAFLFPGQGSQYLGMAAAVAVEYADALAPWDRAAAVELDEGLALHDVVFPPAPFGEEARDEQLRRLTATEWAQPALAAASLSWLTLLRRLGVRADCVAGHSFGELVALHAAGALGEEALLRLARRRGELMRDCATGEGGMTAVAAPVEAVRELLRGVEGVVIANHNAPSQVVLSGPVRALEAVERAIAARGVGFTRLPVANAFHSPLVSSSSGPLRRYLDEVTLAPPAIEVYGNATAAPYPPDPDAIREAISRQLAEPVRFVDEIEAMYAAGVRTFIEVGPKAVLSRLVSATLSGRRHRVVAVDDGSGRLEAWLSAIGQLVEAGVPMDLSALDADLEPPTDREPARSKVAVQVNGALATQTARAPRPPAPPAFQVAPVATPEHVRAAPPAPERAPDGAAPAQRQASGPAAAPVAAAAADALLRRRLLEVQARYQQAMAEAHLAFVEAAGASLAELDDATRAAPAEARVDAPARPPPRAPRPATLAAAPLHAPVTAAAAPPPAARATAPAPAGRSERDMAALLAEVVSDKTGFPVEAMQPDMDLERDLGIDSIKRVEILAELRRRIPALADVKPAALATHRTLQEIARLIAGVAEAPGDGGEARAERPGAPAPASGAAAVPEPMLDLLRSVIAEKTGFPEELLHPETDLHQDLGVDSIKRVEVLVALRNRLPVLSTVQPAELASLRTIAEIAGFLGIRADA